ncbi:MAG: proton-conducting transporter membrane subunit, partial [Holosporales bacterium]
PGMAVCGGLLLLSMAGIPPLAGFFGKLFVFESVVASGFSSLAIIGVLASVVAAYYYLRVCKVMFFDAPVTGRVLLNERSLRSVVLAMTGIAALFIIAPQPLVTLSAQASASLFAGLQP